MIGARRLRAGRRVHLAPPRPGRLAAGAVVGGLLMGYGARLAYGCNIGAYLGGIASMSLHGRVWGVMALLGTWAGLRLRPSVGSLPAAGRGRGLLTPARPTRPHGPAPGG